MEHLHSPSTPEVIISVNDVFRDIWPHDACLEISVALERTATPGGRYVEPFRKTHSSAGIPTVPERPRLGGGHPCKAAVADYRLATEEELLTAAKSSDGHAFVELSHRCAGMVHHKVLRILRNREDTEDIVQDALLQAYTHLESFRGSCRFSSWLTKIAVNYALTLVRKRRSRTSTSCDRKVYGCLTSSCYEVADPSPSVEKLYVTQQAQDLLSDAISCLPSCYRGVLEQYYGREQSLRETASALGITVAATKSRLMRARVKVRSTLEIKRRRAGYAC